MICDKGKILILGGQASNIDILPFKNIVVIDIESLKEYF
jgi:hypothetical protein